MMGDTEYSLTPDCHEQVEAEANYGAGRLLFLQALFDDYVRSSKPCFDLVQGAQKDFGNTLTTSFWRVVETLDVPALGPSANAEPRCGVPTVVSDRTRSAIPNRDTI